MLDDDDAPEPQLGSFDEDTWSAEVLAAQGRRADQVSLEEIDWLSRLRRDWKTRQGFVTGLLENLGDDPRHQRCWMTSRPCSSVRTPA